MIKNTTSNPICIHFLNIGGKKHWLNFGLIKIFKNANKLLIKHIFCICLKGL